MCFVYAAYVNDPTKRRTTTGFSFTFSGVAVMYRSKTQLINALSPMEVYLIDAVTYANTAKFLECMLWGLGFHQDSPTPIYEYNDPTIYIANYSFPTERTRHIDVRLFSIQVWKEYGDLIVHNIPGIIKYCG